MIILFDHKSNNLFIPDKSEVIDKIYYLEASVPTKEQILSGYKKDKEIKKLIEDNGDNDNKSVIKLIDAIKNEISKIEDKIPLFDIYSENLYIISKDNVYDRVINQNYRFPTEKLYNELNTKYESMPSKMELENIDPIVKRKYKKLELIINFLKSFDLNELYSTYMRVFYLYSDEVGKNISLCRRPSFLPHFTHLKPYYTQNEITNIALNMNVERTCEAVAKNDISAKILLEHEQYMIKQNRVGLVQYYTLQGSYFMNQYLRQLTNYDYRNDYMESLIIPMWELINNAPSFDNNYILYRFVHNDNYLKEINIGDIYTDKGFTSTTRDPFYRSDLYKFGFILIKINIPKNVKGVALCVETLSHFPNEQEILLSPLSMLRLDSRDSKCEYFHIDKKFSAQIRTKYEFTYVGKEEIRMPKRPEYPFQSKTIDFLEIMNTGNIDTITLEEKIRFFTSKYVNDLGQFYVNIEKNTFTIITERYDSTSAYKKFYGVTNQNGFLMYTIYNNYILFMIEIGELGTSDNNEGRYMYVNYYVKYSTYDKNKIYSNDGFLKFISSIAYYFNINRIILWANFKTCDVRIDADLDIDSENVNDPNELKDIINSDLTINKATKQKLSELKQRSFINDKIDKFMTQQKKISINDNKNDKKKEYTEETYMKDMKGGGTYCIDFYDYFKHNKKTYSEVNQMDMYPKFSYSQLDKMKHTTIDKLLEKSDLDEIYQIYDKIYKVNVGKDNVASFYVWMIENKCYLMDILIDKMDRIFRVDNPFESCYYVLNPLSYLYNKNHIATIPSFTIQSRTTHVKDSNVQKNKYRIDI